ncbi:hypothetical protein [Schleiferia thermophila]|uniref:hypothetical protein n=1 Tax=Schleiferia thermophila TaxID=884107 RepID=UPI003EEAB4B2
MSAKHQVIGLLVGFAIIAGCKKKNTSQQDPPLAPLSEILPGTWSVTDFSGSASLNLSGVEYQLERKIKSGELIAVFPSDLSQMHFSGEGIFETSIKVSGQILQKMDQPFSYSEQNTLYTITFVGTNSLNLAPGTASGGETTADIRRNNTTEIVLLISQSENIENLGPIIFKNEYTLQKNP